MSIRMLSAALALFALSAVSVQAGGRGCEACGGGGHGQNGHLGILYGRLYPGLDRHFNCGCQGSYKYPVPPLSTYHWPGLYSHQLMTEYHSPWRFPPIKRYADEKLEVQPDDSPIPGPDREALPPAGTGVMKTAPKEVQHVDFASPPIVPGQSEAMSLKLKRVSQAAP